MKTVTLTLLAALFLLAPHQASAGLSGSTYTMDSAFSFAVANADVTISNVVPGVTNAATLIISNSSASTIKVYWVAPGRAVGVETTNRVILPAGELVEFMVNAVFPSLVIYTTKLEYQMPPIFMSTNDIIPELLYYKMTEGFGPTTPPVFLADSSMHGGTTGTVTASTAVSWVSDQTSSPNAALHFDGYSTSLDTQNNTLFNFTTNLFSINLWVRVLAYNPVLAGNGVWANTGWFLTVNPYGAIVMVSSSPGFGTYVGTGANVVPLGQWCMLTAVRTSTTTVLLYENGVQQPTAGSFADPAPCTDSLLFGNYRGGIHYYGDLGVVRIFNRPLATNEINSLYTQGLTP